MTSIESVRLGLDLELKKQFSSADEFTKYFLSLKKFLFTLNSTNHGRKTVQNLAVRGRNPKTLV